ncbi:MAG: putative phosphatase [Acidimicrobiaceae bacterium]|jgi:glycerol 3-phosphatase-2|nr:putative phosphatase [Acidimicrobiaceae bacterium]
MKQCWLFDLDGVVWLGDDPIPGSADAIGRLVASGRRAAYFTNNSYPRRSDHLDKLHRFGLDAADEDLLTSSEAAAGLCEPGERALVLGGPGIIEALLARRVDALDASSAPEGEGFDAVLVGLDPHLDFARLGAATRAVARGARLIGTNDDATFPTPQGLQPGGGAVLAAVAYASGAKPVVAGKPYEPSVELAARRLEALQVVVGDRPSTDGALARRLHVHFALVLSGVTPRGHGPLDPAADVEADDVAALVERLLAGDLETALPTLGAPR